MNTVIKYVTLSFFSFCLFYGCGVDQKQLDDAENRIKVLEQKGIPDSILSAPKVHLYQSRASLKIGNSGHAKKSADSLFLALDKIENEYQENLDALKPQVESLLQTVKQKKENLTGMHLQVADSVEAVVNSYLDKKWYLQAHTAAKQLDSLIPQLLQDEEKAKKIRSTLTGTWLSQRVPEQNTFKAIETRKYTFNSNGQLHTVEKMKGQTYEDLKEDWEFISWGAWDLKGDTIVMSIEREKCVRQNFSSLKVQNGRKQWIENRAPTYDSTITDGRKDKYVTYEYIKEYFKKIKK